MVVPFLFLHDKVSSSFTDIDTHLNMCADVYGTY